MEATVVKLGKSTTSERNDSNIPMLEDMERDSNLLVSGSSPRQSMLNFDEKEELNHEERKMLQASETKVANSNSNDDSLTDQLNIKPDNGNYSGSDYRRG